MKLARWALVLSLPAALCLGTAACSSSGSSSGRGTGAAGATAASGGALGSAQGGASLSFGGSSNAGASGAGAACAATSTSAKLVPLDLYVMMDSSKSMLEVTSSGTSKWKAVSDALAAFFADPNNSSVNVALKFFPDEQPTVPALCSANSECGGAGPCDQRRACVSKKTFSKIVTTLCESDTDCEATEACVPVQRCADSASCAKVYCVADSAGGAACPNDCKPFDGYCRERDVCTAASYAVPAVPFAELPGAAPTLVSALSARTPDGFTPTGPALSGALSAAVERAKQNQNHKVAVVLVTDGLPGGFIPDKPPASCLPGNISGVAGVLATGFAGGNGNPAIPTFVIGVFGPCDLVDQNVNPQTNLDTLAKAGGTDRAVVIRTDQNVSEQLQSALKLVRTSAIACQYTIPSSDAALDWGKVNVNFSSAATGNTVVGYVNGSDDSACDPERGGWHYDRLPKDGAPTQIVVCPKTCDSFQSFSDGRVDIALGCETVVIR